MAAPRGAPRRTDVAGWAFGLLLAGIGVANLALVHPVPAAAYALLSLAYLPPARALLERGMGLRIPTLVRLVLAVLVVVFTLGVSDLGDMLDGGA